MDIESFPPIAGENARVLILGSIPGKASLQANQYYAHPRNQFWPILGDLLGFEPSANYALKTQALLAAGIALWDVVQSCYRPGSLDADIAKHSITPNDFAGLFATHPQISHVFFNGATAEHTFRRLVMPQLPPDSLTFQRLPSTSPAHASLSYQEKLQHWRAISRALASAAKQ